MKILKLLNKFFIVFLTLCFSKQILLATEPVDIWNIEKKNIPNKVKVENNDSINTKIIQGVKIDQQLEDVIVNKELDASLINLIGLYDPAENGLAIDMWSNSDGDEIKSRSHEMGPTFSIVI